MLPVLESARVLARRPEQLKRTVAAIVRQDATATANDGTVLRCQSTNVWPNSDHRGVTAGSDARGLAEECRVREVANPPVRVATLNPREVEVDADSVIGRKLNNGKIGGRCIKK